MGMQFNTLLRAILAGGGAAPAAVLPQLGSIVFKLSADSLVLSDGAAVSSWTDSVNGVGATQGTGANQPIFKTNQYGGKPSVRFDGVDDMMTIGRPAALTAAVDSGTYTYICVYKVISAKTNGVAFAAGASGNGIYVLADGSKLGQYGGTHAWSYPSNAGFNVVGSTSAANALSTSGAYNRRHYLNGGCYTIDVGSLRVTGGSSFSLGCEVGNTLYGNIDLFDVIVWDRELTPAEMMQVQMSICDKYSQTYPWAASSTILVLDGNSHTAGTTGDGDVTLRASYITTQSLGLVPGQYTVAAMPGATMAKLLAKSGEWTSIKAVTGKSLKIFSHEYYNSKAVAPATLQATTNSYCSTVRAFGKLALGTSFSTAADPDANRVAHAAYYDANYATHCDAYMPLHNNTSIGTQTAFATNGGGAGLNLYNGDGIHLNAAGNAVIAPLMTTAIQALP